ncbi:MAG: phosphoribosyltransferase [Candidatus Gottesmanbacteria bacterium]|nr:phosphoribosyltransferase [Candidatus Gottesmanbacteria bacterium]
MADQYLPVTWNEFHSLSLLLAEQILKSKKPIDEIVAIARGGLSLGLILTDLLQKPISTITIQSYTDIEKQGELTITSKLGKQIKDKNILLVDDIADSGKTFQRAIKYLQAFRPASITTAALFYKPHSVFRPNFFAKETSLWILLPHEVAEWITTFTASMTKEGKSKTEIHAFLQKIGYNDDQIEFAHTHYPS